MEKYSGSGKTPIQVKVAMIDISFPVRLVPYPHNTKAQSVDVDDQDELENGIVAIFLVRAVEEINILKL